MPKLTNDDACKRAMAAYRRSGGSQQPSGSGDIATIDGVDYVVLRNANGILKVYQLTDDGRLKGLRETPAGLL